MELAANNSSNVCHLHIVKTRTEQGRPGTEATYCIGRITVTLMNN